VDAPQPYAFFASKCCVRWRPPNGRVQKFRREGNAIEDRIYNQKDFDRTLVIDDRTRLVAQKVSDFLKESGDRVQKTIVFCVDEPLAEEVGSLRDQLKAILAEALLR
jgi:type I site-specific restriction endonuclease